MDVIILVVTLQTARQWSPCLIDRGITRIHVFVGHSECQGLGEGIL